MSAEHVTAYLEPVGSLVIESKSGEVMARLDLAAAAPWVAALAELAGAVLRAAQPPQIVNDELVEFLRCGTPVQPSGKE